MYNNHDLCRSIVDIYCILNTVHLTDYSGAIVLPVTASARVKTFKSSTTTARPDTAAGHASAKITMEARTTPEPAGGGT